MLLGTDDSDRADDLKVPVHGAERPIVAMFTRSGNQMQKQQHALEGSRLPTVTLKTTRHPRGQRGAVLIEAALVLPVILTVIIGIIEFGLLYANYSTMVASSRSGARVGTIAYSQAPTGGTETVGQTAAIAEIVSATEQDLEVLNNAEPVGMLIYKVDPSSESGAPYGGFPGSNMSGGCTSKCIKYTWNNATKHFDRQGTGSWPDPQRCLNDQSVGSADTIDSLGVYVQIEHDFLTGIVGQKRVLGGHSVVRLEPVPSESC